MQRLWVCREKGTVILCEADAVWAIKLAALVVGNHRHPLRLLHPGTMQKYGGRVMERCSRVVSESAKYGTVGEGKVGVRTMFVLCACRGGGHIRAGERCMDLGGVLTSAGFERMHLKAKSATKRAPSASKAIEDGTPPAR